MAGVDKDFSGEARAQPGIKIGYLEQEPPLDPNKDVRGNVEDGVREALDALARLDKYLLNMQNQMQTLMHCKRARKT
jgi:ATPase subunit of ABC transporter with duplicated ATPase domains